MNDIEVWKDVKNYEGIYQVSNLGRVKSLKRKVGNDKGFRLVKERILKMQKHPDGYLQLGLNKKGKKKCKKVHQLVVEAFLNHLPDGTHRLVVNHIDFNRANNCLENLEIVTHRENTNRKHLKSSSKYVGVRKTISGWTASIHINGKSKYLGSFNNEHDAHLAYQKALQTI